MQGKHTVTINGRKYDAVTGMPVGPMANGPMHHTSPHEPDRTVRNLDFAPAQHTRHTRALHSIAAGAVHQAPQRSQTLQRAPLHRPVSHMVQAARPAQSSSDMVPPTIHPAVARALGHTPLAPPQSSKELKEMLIRERLAEVSPQDDRQSPSRRHRGRSRITAVLATTMAVLLLGGYFTFLQLPNLSLRVAASQAGIAANFPAYTPEGYNFQGPITYSPGAVAISFQSAGNDGTFTVKQQRSTWDSQKLLTDYISKETSSYLTYQADGTTIYSFGNSAAWVNSGLLYTVDGTAHLTSDQILRIANSL